MPDLIQKARQVIGQVQNRESQMELLMSILELAKAYGDAPIDWKGVAKKAAQSESPHVIDIWELIDFLKYYSGGKDAKFIHRLNKFVSFKAPADRHVQNKFLAARNKLEVNAVSGVVLIYTIINLHNLIN